jgi:hypothetical protein
MRIVVITSMARHRREGRNLTCPAMNMLERKTRYKNLTPIEREAHKR